MSSVVYSTSTDTAGISINRGGAEVIHIPKLDYVYQCGTIEG